MKCYKCGDSPGQSKKEFYPIDPPGAGRRWSCKECMTEEQIKSIPSDVKQLVEDINNVY